jgi:hypothetical protein
MGRSSQERRGWKGVLAGVLLGLAACGAPQEFQEETPSPEIQESTPPEEHGNPKPPPSVPPPEACRPRSCKEQSATCGTLSDGCGGTLQCGTCGALGQTCGGSGPPNVCGTPDYGVDTACSRDGVCFLNPKPVSHDFKDVWGRSVNDFWVVGNAGYILHGGPEGLTALPSEAELSGIWGSAAEDVWAVGSLMVRFDGRRWLGTMIPERFLLDVYGTGANNVWAVGEGGVAYAWNGQRWQREDLGTTADLYGVWAHGSHVWAVGTGSTIRVRDEKSWHTLAPPKPGLTFTGVWGTGPQNVWVTSETSGEALFHWDGRAWSPVRLPFSALYGISGKSASDILVVGEEGAAQYDGSRWFITVNGTPSRLLGVWQAADGKVVVGSAGRVQRAPQGGAWRALDQGTRTDFVALSAPEADRWWLGGEGSLWVGPNIAGPISGPGNAFAGQGPGRLWAAGDFGRVDLHTWDSHGNGTNFFYLPRTFNFQGVYPVRDLMAWLAGVDSATGEGVLVRLDGHGAWTRYPLSGPGAMNAIHGSGPDDVWAVGDSVIAHWDGTAWTEMRGPGLPSFRAVHALGRDLAWAVSTDGVWHWNGKLWTPVFIPTGLLRAQPRTLFTDSRDELYVAGDGGLLLHYTTWNRSWRRIETGTRKSLRALSGGPGTLIISGDDGTVLRLYR